MRLEQTAEPCVVVIFGATGDLTKRKLLPSLYHLAQQQLIPAEFAILGTARQQLSDEEYRKQLLEALRKFGDDENIDQSSWNTFAQGIFYEPGDVKDPETYTRIKSRLRKIDDERKTQGNRIFYLATAPGFFGEIAGQLGTAGLAGSEQPGWVRIVVEKPFGHDLESARELNERLGSVFREDQIYRIDHYLGKETVQNLLVFRFANSIFEPLWNNKYIDHIQITNAEAIGVEGRGEYYDRTGALRDMMQNHVFQVTSLIVMERPSSLNADAVRDEKVRAMQAVQAIAAERIDEVAVRGQYGPGKVIGETVVGYRQEPDVNPQSSTETFAALKLQFDNERWSNVPFYLRSGKRLARRVTEISVQFKRVEHQLFSQTHEPLKQNVLVIRIQPNEGITLRFAAKLPGQQMRIRWVNMDFRYGSSFGVKPPEAYERLLLDCMLGDSTLYARRDMVERCWEIVKPVLEAWKKPAADFPNYEAGSSGPKTAFELIERDKQKWRRL